MLPENTVETPYSWFNRAAFYKEIDRFSGMDYVKKLIQPRYPEKTIETMRMESGLRSSAEFLENAQTIRVIHNIDDPILGENDIRFLSDTLSGRVTWFDRGGHLGNLYLEEYQKTLLENLALTDLAAASRKSAEKTEKKVTENDGTKEN